MLSVSTPYTLFEFYNMIYTRIYEYNDNDLYVKMYLKEAELVSGMVAFVEYNR